MQPFRKKPSLRYSEWSKFASILNIFHSCLLKNMHEDYQNVVASSEFAEVSSLGCSVALCKTCGSTFLCRSNAPEVIPYNFSSVVDVNSSTEVNINQCNSMV